jgi:hypothetical protein
MTTRYRASNGATRAEKAWPDLVWSTSEEELGALLAPLAPTSDNVADLDASPREATPAASEASATGDGGCVLLLSCPRPSTGEARLARVAVVALPSPRATVRLTVRSAERGATRDIGWPGTATVHLVLAGDAFVDLAGPRAASVHSSGDDAEIRFTLPQELARRNITATALAARLEAMVLVGREGATVRHDR